MPNSLERSKKVKTKDSTKKCSVIKREETDNSMKEKRLELTKSNKIKSSSNHSYLCKWIRDNREIKQQKLISWSKPKSGKLKRKSLINLNIIRLRLEKTLTWHSLINLRHKSKLINWKQKITNLSWTQKKTVSIKDF